MKKAPTSSQPNTYAAWIEAMRLRTLPVSIAGVICASGYSLIHNVFSWWITLACLIFAILCQIASNFANEYFDYKAGRDTPGREGPRRGVTEGDISPKAMRNAIFTTLFIASAIGLTLAAHAGWWLIAIGALIGIGALAYSAGPFPLSTHCLGEIAVIIFFGIVPVNFTFYLQALEFSPDVFLGSIAIGLMGANVLIVNNVRDIPDDIRSSKHTLATAFGIVPMVFLYIINSIVAVALMSSQWWELGFYSTAIPLLYLIVSIAIAIKLKRLKGAALTPMLAATSMLMFVYSLLWLINIIINI